MPFLAHYYAHSNIGPKSPFLDTDLKVGYEILSINRQHFDNADKAVDYLKHVDGLVDILASNHPFPGGGDLVFIKNKPADLVNSITFSRLSYTQSLVTVEHIHTNGPFAKTNLAVGDVILTINNKVVANPVVASRLLLANDDSQVWILSLSRRKFLEAAIKSMVIKQDKSKPWTKPLWIPPNKISIGRKDWQEQVVLRFESGICEIDEPWLFLEQASPSSNTNFKVQYSAWYTETVKPRVAEINEYLSKNIRNIEVAVQRSPYHEIYPDEALVASLAQLSHQHKQKKLTDAQYEAAKNKTLGIRMANPTESSCWGVEWLHERKNSD